MDDDDISYSDSNETTFDDPEIAIGMDIGTFQCSVAFWDGTQVELLRYPQDQKFFRFFVTVEDGVPSAGLTNELSHEHDMLSGATIFNVKRLLGRVDTDPVLRASKTVPFQVQTLDVGVRPFTAVLDQNIWRSVTSEDALVMFLRELREMAEDSLMKSMRNVVLTVPVSFSRLQVIQFERMCTLAGLTVLRLMHEPSAVALLYAQQHLQQLIREDNMVSTSEKIALIFNIGAGFCDVAVTATGGGNCISHIKALAGSSIGGEDILQNMMHYLLPDCENLMPGKTRSMGLLRGATQDAIHQLSSQTSVQVEVDLGNGIQISKVITREDFEEVNHNVFEKCDKLVRQCLHDASVEVDNIDDVILVGGCSSIPKIRNLVTDICNKTEIYQGMNPLKAAVRGAALGSAVTLGINDPFGGMQLLTIQVAPHGIGIRADGDRFVPVIPRNTALPARRELTFTTVDDNQTEALIIVYEGEGDEAEENHLLGFFKFVGIPPAPKGVAEINVCMDIVDSLTLMTVEVGVMMPESHQVAASPLMEVKLPTDDGLVWCVEALHKTYGSTLGLVQKNPLSEMQI